MLVTIDDLEALVSEVARHSNGSVPSLEFEGGTFNDPSDLRKLTDAELGRIVVKSPEIEVHLAPSEAKAIGDPRACEAVYSSWARSRQTRLRAERTLGWRKVLSAVWTGILYGGFILLVSAAPIGMYMQNNTLGPLARWIANAVLAISAAAVLFTVARRLAPPESWAVIRAITLDEFRKEAAISNRHWQTATISLGAIATTLAAALITVLLTNK